jgi:hypothetical protein
VAGTFTARDALFFMDCAGGRFEIVELHCCSFLDLRGT